MHKIDLFRFEEYVTAGSKILASLKGEIFRQKGKKYIFFNHLGKQFRVSKISRVSQSIIRLRFFRPIKVRTFRSWKAASF